MTTDDAAMTTTRRKREPWESIPYTHPAFRPYTTALGELALAWNGLHSEMALLFCTLMGGGYEPLANRLTNSVG